MTQAHFDELYSTDPDPFGIGERWYEQRKIAAMAAALGAPRYRSVWDTACGTGHLTAVLAERADLVLATDVSVPACALTRRRLTDLGHDHVTVSPHALPAAPPIPSAPDLVVLSEVLYYLTPADLDLIAPMVDGVAAADVAAEVVAVNWRHFPGDAQMSGADAAERLGAGLTALGWAWVVRHEDEDFLLHTWRRTVATP